MVYILSGNTWKTFDRKCFTIWMDNRHVKMLLKDNISGEMVLLNKWYRLNHRKIIDKYLLLTDFNPYLVVKVV